MFDYETSNDSSSAIFAFFAGALIGAGVALLLAPQSGAKTRRWISNYADQAKKQMDSAIDSGKDYLQTGIERGKEYFDSAQNMMKETSEQLNRKQRA